MIRRALVLLGSLGAARAATTNWGAGVGWCYSSLDREIGKATGQACWDLCAATYTLATTPDSTYAYRLVAVDWNEWEECFCQSGCQCMMDVGDPNGYLMTMSNITSLPGPCPPGYYDDDDDHPGCNGMVEWPYLLLAGALTAIVATIISFGCVCGGCCNSCPAESVISPIHLSSTLSTQVRAEEYWTTELGAAAPRASRASLPGLVRRERGRLVVLAGIRPPVSLFASRNDLFLPQCPYLLQSKYAQQQPGSARSGALRSRCC